MILNYIRTSCLIFFVLFLMGCTSKTNVVVVYVSVDQHYADPVIKKFEAETGLDVLPVFDMEASKTTGLVNRILAERKNPRADVFWSGEFVQTIALKENDALQTYFSPYALDIPDIYKDPDGFWTGFSGRARVFIVNTDLLKPGSYPTSLSDMVSDSVFPENKGMARPLFGTTYTHAAALYAYWGRDSATSFFRNLAENGTRILSGNSTVRDYVARGQLAYGLTDTDDVCSAIRKGQPVAMVLPDQQSSGTFVIPNTIAMIKDCSNRDHAEQFINYMLSPETIDYLVEIGWCHVPLRKTNVLPDCPGLSEVRHYDLDLIDVYQGYTEFRDTLKQYFLN